jgi:glycerol kinase
VESARQVDKVFKPKMKAARRAELYAGWHQAVDRVRER